MEEKQFEQTLVLIKPDALKLSLTGYVLSQLSEFHTGLRFAGLKVVHVTRMLAEEHYVEHKGKFFYPPLIDYIMGKIHYADEPHKRRVIALAYSGPNAVAIVRELSGPTNPHVARESAPGSIRALGTVVPVKDEGGRVVGERMDNLVHGSASAEEAEREVKLWFKPSDIMPYMRTYPTEICDQQYCLNEDGELSTTPEPGSTCVLAPGNLVWKSDLEALRTVILEEGVSKLDWVVAKYLINREQAPL